MTPLVRMVLVLFLTWLVVSVALILVTVVTQRSIDQALWLLLPIGTLAAAAVGAMFGSGSQRRRLAAAEGYAASAELLARDYRESAMKGRALAALLQADEAFVQAGAATTAYSDVETRSRHAATARSLFGDLVVRQAANSE